MSFHWEWNCARHRIRVSGCSPTRRWAPGEPWCSARNPHVLGPVERSPHGLVAWSLGNFVFPAGSAAAERTAILRVQLTADGAAGFDVLPARSGVQPTLG